ncbi:hypothetical protein ACS2UW_26890, partial [Bacillus cereus group sp. BC318]
RRVAWQVTVGDEPEGVAQSPDGKWLLVTSEEDSTVAWIDLATRTVAEEMETDARPRHIEFEASGAKVWIAAEMAGTVQIADTATKAIEQTL